MGLTPQDSDTSLRIASPQFAKAGLAWLLLLGAALAVTLLDPVNTSEHYFNAAGDWVAGADLYRITGHGFLYLPHSAILTIPFAHLPPPIGQLLWRVVGLGVFAYGLSRWVGFPRNRSLSRYWSVVIPSMVLCAYSLRIGQATLLMTGLALVAFGDLERQRFKSAATWLALGVAVKPLVIVFLLLATAVQRQIRLPIVIVTAALALAPFAFQRPEYVWSQYQDFGSNLRVVMELGNDNTWSQLFGMLGTIDIQTPPTVQTIVRILAALVTLVLCVTAFRRFDRTSAIVWLYSLGATYLMLFNPRNEASTYCVLGPAIGFFLADEVCEQRRWVAGAALATGAILIAGDYEFGKHFIQPGSPVVWLAPLTVTLFSVYLGVRFRHALIEQNRAASG